MIVLNQKSSTKFLQLLNYMKNGHEPHLKNLVLVEIYTKTKLKRYFCHKPKEHSIEQGDLTKKLFFN